MNAIFIDLDNNCNPMNGQLLATWHDIHTVFQSVCGRRPFMFQLQFQDGSRLDVGLAGDVGCVQHTHCDELPPYRMACTAASQTSGTGEFEFVVGGTATPIDGCYCIPRQIVERIVKQYFEAGTLTDDVLWEEV